MSSKKQLEIKDFELSWATKWESKGLYITPALNNNSSPAKLGSFCIQLPPPNVTGTLHMGHAFNQTLMDILTRWQRMRKKRTLWLPGTDHAGIATQMIVERQLLNDGKSRQDMGRAAFLNHVWKWKKKSGTTITKQMRRLGSSCDWSKEYFTMDSTRSKVVERVFVELFNQGLIYKGKRLVNWDPVLMTAVSDLEVVSEEESGHMWEIRYPVVQNENNEKVKSFSDDNQVKYLVVATTRPETLIGDVAVAVHPKDKRYSKFIGQTLKVPIIDRTIPIIADENVDMDFGTGCVKITPAHDFNDYEMGKRHNLPTINIFSLNAKINENGPEKYLGLDRFEARRKILEELKKINLLQAEKTHSLVIKRGDRSGSIIEPMLTDQWFVAMNKAPIHEAKGVAKSLRQQGLEAITSGNLKLFPENWNSTYINWLENLQDWCISRQLWWGHQIPAWYKADKNGKAIFDGLIFVAINYDDAKEQAVNQGWNGPIIRDPDVLDTWFSSALIPFSSLVEEESVWNENSNSPRINSELDSFIPSEVLVTGFDIIFFWVARMVMMTSHFCNKIPFKNVYIHALVRDADGNKMSKSRGNTLDPIDLIDGISLEDLIKKRCSGLMNPKQAKEIEKKTILEFPNGIRSFGTDALRFTFANLASPGRDISFDLSRCEGYGNFCNKLRNASRFVLMNCENMDNGLDKCGGECGPDGYLFFGLADKWIVTRLHESIKIINDFLSKYRFDLAAKELYEFVWNEFCDWYLEFAKTQLNSVLDNKKRATRRTMLRTLETILRLSHPFIPFITEELWQLIAPLAKKSKKLQNNEFDSIMLSSFPKYEATKLDFQAQIKINQIKDLISSIRTLRSEMKLSPGDKIPLIILDHSKSNDRQSKDLNLTTDSPERHEFILAIKSLAKISEIQVVNFLPEKFVNSPSKLVGNLKLVLEVNVDPESEKQRIKKEIEKYEFEVNKAKNKLANKNFVEKAPQKIVIQEKKRMAVFSEKVQKLKHQITFFD
ncbi:MAG: valine--tRNA ligase [Betaproteobacteria bacterium TMED41]|nr:MAG: valine--tRNA ligase [Betaproteobacteria bacterium TMED41]